MSEAEAINTNDLSNNLKETKILCEKVMEASNPPTPVSKVTSEVNNLSHEVHEGDVPNSAAVTTPPKKKKKHKKKEKKKFQHISDAQSLEKKDNESKSMNEIVQDEEDDSSHGVHESDVHDSTAVATPSKTKKKHKKKENKKIQHLSEPQSVETRDSESKSIEEIARDIESASATPPSSHKKKKKNKPMTPLPPPTKKNDHSLISITDAHTMEINTGFVKNMKVPAKIFVNSPLCQLLMDELSHSEDPSSGCGCSFLPAITQASNVASLPGIVKHSLAMPDVHSGYGFCIGNVAAFDMDRSESIVSPGGVGFDINCGVRLVRTNLSGDDIDETARDELAKLLFDHIPVGVGTKGVIPLSKKDLNEILETGIDWAVTKGYAWPADKIHCEEQGRMMTADFNKVSQRAKTRGMKQLGTLGGGNHYAEIQVVEEIYDEKAAEVLKLPLGAVCIMIHSGSRGLGHQVATDALATMEGVMRRDKVKLNDRQLACARLNTQEGKDYLAAMSAAANYAWVNRSAMTYLTRRAFEKYFNRSAESMGMDLVYDVCHNIAKIETHVVDGVEKKLLVHRKGATRAFPPHHPMIPDDYKEIGQPVLVGGTMGTCSYVLVGTERGMEQSFGSTCHGAGRALSRNQSRRMLDYEGVLENMKKKGISIEVANKKLVMEEAPESYKDVCEVVDTCELAGLSKKVVKLRPIAVIKG